MMSVPSAAAYMLACPLAVPSLFHDLPLPSPHTRLNDSHSPPLHLTTIMSFTDNTSSSTGMNTQYTDGPGAATHSEGFNQSQDQGAYSEMQSGQGSNDMGGGRGAMGSGVAGGYEGNSQSSQTTQTGEKADWLDKGLESLGKKAGVNIVSLSLQLRHLYGGRY